MTKLQSLQHPTTFFQSRFGEFGELAEAVEGWDLDWQQLDRGRLEAGLGQISTPLALLTRVSFSRRFYQRGATPPGFLTFGFIRDGIDKIRWCGQPGNGSSLMVFRPGGEYESVSPPGFGANTLSYSEVLLNRTARHLDLGEVRDLWSGGNELFDCSADRLVALREKLRAVFAAAAELPASATQSLRREVEEEIPRLLLRALAEGSGTPESLSCANRSRATRRALALIRESSDEVLTVRDLCEGVGVSERTLRYAFREQIGTSPKQYLQAVRLNGVRRDLLRSGLHARIADIANRWGFWHMGQFAADYRRQFSELPSETLRWQPR